MREEQNVFQSQRLYKPFEQPGIAGQRVLVSQRGRRKTKARQIQGYAAKTTA